MSQIRESFARVREREAAAAAAHKASKDEIDWGASVLRYRMGAVVAGASVRGGEADDFRFGACG